MSKLEFVHAFKPIKFPNTFATSGHTNNSNLTPPLLSTSTQAWWTWSLTPLRIRCESHCSAYLKSFTHTRINLSPFTKDFRVWETPIEDFPIFQSFLCGSYYKMNLFEYIMSQILSYLLRSLDPRYSCFIFRYVETFCLSMQPLGGALICRVNFPHTNCPLY